MNKKIIAKLNEPSGGKVFVIVCLVILIIFTISLLLPFIMGLMNSLKDPMAYNEMDPMTILEFPNPLSFSNYSRVFSNFVVQTPLNGDFYLENMLLNSIIYAVGGSFMHMVACCLVSYAVARYDNKISKVLYWVVLFAMMTPVVGSLPSEIRMLQATGLYDKIWSALIVNFNFLGLHFLLMHAAFKAIPKEFDEAAKIDGAGHFRIFFTIMLPLVKTTLLTIFLLKFIQLWNDYQTPLVYYPNWPTLAFGVYKLTNDARPDMAYAPLRLASCMIVFVPILILYTVFHKRLIGSSTEGGVKG